MIKTGYISFCVLLLLFYSCGSEIVTQETNSEKQKIAVDEHADIEEDPNFAELRKNYIANYNFEEIIDTIFTNSNGSQVKLHSRYYCLFDNGLDIPKKYIWEGSSKNFITHNFAHDIIIINSDDTIFNRTITKKDFTDALNKEWKNYSTIKRPNLSINLQEETVRFSYSISIPITDLGESFAIVIDKNGSHHIE